MANKQISKDLQELIVKLQYESHSVQDIRKIVNKPHTTVQYEIKTFHKNKSFESPGGSGRPKKINLPLIELRILKYVNKDLKTSTVHIAEELKQSNVVNMTPETAINFPISKELYAYVPRKKPLFSTAKVEKRLHYAMYYFKES